MFSRDSWLLVVVLLACATSSPVAAQSPRLLVLDIGARGGSEQHRLRVLDIESGKVAAQHQLGWMSSIAVSTEGDFVAALNYYRGEQGSRLKILRSDSLTVAQSGRLRPFRRFEYQQGAGQDMVFSPDGRHLLLQSPDGERIKLIRLTRELDDDGYFRIHPPDLFGAHPQELVVPRCVFAQFLRIDNWPRVHIWNPKMQLLEVVDLGGGGVSSRLQLAEDPELAGTDSPVLEDLSYSPDHLRRRGSVISDTESTTAYFIARPPTPSAHSTTEPAHLASVDLTTDPPRFLGRTAQPKADLTGIAVACESADKLFVLRANANGGQGQKTSQLVEVFHASDLTFECQVELPIGDCRQLAVSPDAKYLYALDTAAAKLAVIDVATLQPHKVLEDVLGDHPFLMFPLPSE